MDAFLAYSLSDTSYAVWHLNSTVQRPKRNTFGVSYGVDGANFRNASQSGHQFVRDLTVIDWVNAGD